MRFSCRAARQRGFTLIELMVVVLIIGIIVGFATLNVGERPLEDRLQLESERSQALIRLAAEQAEGTGVDLGIRLFEGGYEFVQLTPLGFWHPMPKESSLRPREIEAPFEAQLSVEERPVVLETVVEEARLLENDQTAETNYQEALARDPDNPPRDRPTPSRVPQILLLSSGEVSPFTLRYSAPGLARGWQLKGSLDGALALESIAVPPP